MTENELNNNNQVVEVGEVGTVKRPKSASKPSTELKSIEDLRLQHGNEIAEIKKSVKELVSANIDWEDKYKKLEDTFEQKDIENEALRKAFWRERNKVSIGNSMTVLDGSESENEGQIISRKVKDILLKRCAEGRYGDFGCTTGTIIG